MGKNKKGILRTGNWKVIKKFLQLLLNRINGRVNQIMIFQQRENQKELRKAAAEGNEFHFSLAEELRWCKANKNFLNGIFGFHALYLLLFKKES